MAKEKREGYSKLLDYWSPPREAGIPVGCIATTYTFDPEMFEEECLSRFLKMDSDVDEDSASYIIEREEKLNNTRCASVLVDQVHSNKKRNPRWDMLSMRYQGTFHPKVTMLYWSEWIRLIVASANITKSGYRENQEIFGVLDFELENGRIKDINAPVSVLQIYLDYFQKCIETNSLSGDVANKRSLDFLDSVRAIVDAWSPVEGKQDKSKIGIDSVLIFPGNKNVFDQLTEIWHKYSNNPPTAAWITSPFFDSPDSPNLPASKIWSIIKPRGVAMVHYICPFESTRTEGKKHLVKAPQSLLSTKPSGRSSVSVDFNGISSFTKDENGKECIRSIHLKCIRLENDEWATYMIGSSNFTSAGTGLSKHSNYEANLVYTINKKKNPLGYKALLLAYLKGEELKLKDIEFSVLYSSEEDDETKAPKLPLFFQSCEAIWDKGTFIRLTFDVNQAITPFSIAMESGLNMFSNIQWESNGKPSVATIPWKEKYLPSGFNVKLDDASSLVWWPLTVADYRALPTPDELRNLTFNELIEILSSSAPLHVSLSRVINSRLKGSAFQNGIDESIDPHKRVDTSGYILQRTRRMSSAINSLRERLSKPVYTKESLDWRLYGPVGVKAFCDALVKEINKSQSSLELQNEELLFFLAELALEIGNLQLQTYNNCIPEDDIKKEINAFLQNLYNDHKKMINKRNSTPIGKYAKKTFNSILTP